MDDVFLFIVCMNNSGSTLLEAALRCCRNAVALPGEGQLLPGIERFMPTPPRANVIRVWTEAEDLFADRRNYDWPAIRRLWMQAWMRHPRYGLAQPRVFLEKSPPNVIRAGMLAEEFPGARFLLMVRNPYAVVEGMRRRTGFPLERCLRHWLRCAELQRTNLEQLRQRVLCTYEEMCEAPGRVQDRIATLVPALSDLSFERTFCVHSLDGRQAGPLHNYNAQSLQLLRPEEMARLSALLRREAALLDFFGYQLEEASGRG